MSDSRTLCQCTHRFTKDPKCLLCGAYRYRCEAIKTTLYKAPAHFNIKQYLASLRRSSTKIVAPKELSEETFLLLTSICQKFVFGNDTLALGLYIYQVLQKMHTSDKFWASVALIVAGKGMELDKNVPYLNRYQRYADKYYSQQDYQQAERAIFEAMNFQVQYSTFITFIDFYLTCGVAFADDILNPSLLEFFEDDIMLRAKEFLRRGTFTRYDPELLALGIVKEVRGKYNMKPWNEHLEQITGYNQEEILGISEGQALRQISRNVQCKLSEVKGINFRRKYDNLIKNQRPLLEKYSSISKGCLKQNSFSSSKLIVGNRSKPSISYSIMDSYNSINSDLLGKRR